MNLNVVVRASLDGTIIVGVFLVYETKVINDKVGP